MTITAKAVETLNEEIQRIPIRAERWPELAVELNQLRSAAEKALQQHKFDRDPFEFMSLLRAHRS